MWFVCLVLVGLVSSQDVVQPDCHAYYDTYSHHLPGRPGLISEDGKLAVPQGTRYVDANEVGEPGDVVMLLASANFLVGANSSLSWWGAFLNETSGSRKIFPKTWFGPKGWNSEGIVPPQWRLC